MPNEKTRDDPLLAKWRSECHPTTIDRILARVPDGTGSMAILKALDTSYHAGPGTYAAIDADRLRSLIDAELSRGREAVEVLREAEWTGYAMYSTGLWRNVATGAVTEDPAQTLHACPCCRGLQPDQPRLSPPGIFRLGHSPDCRLAKVIAPKP
jgi:hypothetical protein